MGPAGRQGGGFKVVVDALYESVTDAGKGVSVPFTFDSKIIDRALQNIRNSRIDARRQIDPGLFSEVSRILDTAVRTGYDASAGGSGFAQEIRRNTEVFSAFKAHRMGRDMASQLLDENGQVRSFREFRKATEDIVDHHVNSWLRTEYDTAVKRSHHAAEMRQFISEADVFPNIEWLPSTAIKPREQHMPFYHHVWPVNDPFWSKHKPGDEWGCQCGWRSTDSPVTDNSGLGGDDIAPPSPGLGGDPAATGEVFSQDHPYFPSDCSRCAFYKPGFRDRLRHLFSARVKECYKCPYLRACMNELSDKKNARRNKELYRRLKEDKNYGHVKYDRASGGMSASHKKHNFDPVGGTYEKTAQKVGRRNGHAVILEKEGGGDIGQRFTEGTWDGLLFEVAGRETATENNVFKGLKHCCKKRNTQIAVLVYPKGGFDENILQAAISRYKGLEKVEGGNQFIHFVRIICIQDDKIVYDKPF